MFEGKQRTAVSRARKGEFSAEGGRKDGNRRIRWLFTEESKGQREGGGGRAARVGDYGEKERHIVEKERKGELQPSSRKKVGARGGEGERRRVDEGGVERSQEGSRVEPEAVGEHCGPEG